MTAREITTDDIEAIKTEHPLADVIARRVKLTRKGHDHIGLCPFHSEKTASFTVSEEKGFYHCFGCGAHGDVIDFIERAEGLKFNEAVAFLTRGDLDATGPRSKPDPATAARREAERQAEENRRIEQARAIWNSAVPATGTVVETYLRSRAITLLVPPSLRFADLKHGPTGLVFPCMVGAIQTATGEITGRDAAQRFLREGRNVKIARPPIGKDFNDTLQAGSNVVPLRRQEASNG